ncbi:hypothetical protein ABB37_08426 [Leptomonas pyrrhocoris]|uniref:cDENN domain-containing protein n=1 Tax=Leptomonas pyrrhocoris TaxID=157538 RepID=A0A0M9FTG7_LEPPY|nr:hypothetical protein ABB37_08426 [Leptomonas pyrrhocoris]KPA75536.1 hypothetical protein ABB37_08426 [Leptomonas pyrrhocoris]|eukprot:XP_015653975.1 hypothetical protein ABB37_08426 [Leptomonas pyrrhocoris]
MYVYHHTHSFNSQDCLHLRTMAGDTASDGIPLLTRLLLVRATAFFDPSFPSDVHQPSASSRPLPRRRSSTAATPAVSTTTAAATQVKPSLRIVAHYTESAANKTASTADPSALRSATTTPKEDADFFAAHATLHQLLSSLASDRLREKVKLRQTQTDIARTAVQLARATAGSSATATAAAGSPDAIGFFPSSIASASSSSSLKRNEFYANATNVDDESSQSGAGSSNSISSNNPQVQGILAATTATFAEDAAWRSLMTPYQPELNPWSLTPVSDEGCYVSLPSPAYVHWCEVQAARYCRAADGAETSSVEPEVQGGPMLYNDVVHYASGNDVGGRNVCSGSGEELGYVHGYVFLLDGAVFAGAGEQQAAATSDSGPLSSSDGEVSVLLWCVLSDAPVFNFMRSLTLEAVTAMSYVAQRTYHAFAESSPSHGAAAEIVGGVGTDVYTSALDSALDEMVVRPLAVELVRHGSVSSCTLPGDSFTVHLPATRGGHAGVAARLQTSSSTASGAATFRRPVELLFPFSDVPLAVLLLSFGEDALRVLQSLLMQEERVVVIGATPQHASACVVSLPSLIVPFTWVSPFVPYLPPHAAAETGLLYTLLSTSFSVSRQLEPHHQPRQSGTPGSSSSQQQQQQVQSAGFLLGSTAGIRPYLMFLSAFGVAEEGGGSKGSRSGRPPRVWIADARTGAVGVCPTEPVSPYVLTDTKAQSENGTRNRNSSTGTDRSCTAHGGACAWTAPVHLDPRAAAPQVYAGGSPRETSQSPYVLYHAVRSTLRTAAELNVMDAASLDVLPPFHDELCDALRRVAPAEKRRQFRHALEALTQHTQARVDHLASLAARLARGLRQARRAAAATAGAARLNGFGTDSVNSTDNGSCSSSISSSNCSSGSDDNDGGGGGAASVEDTFQKDENASFRAVAEARAASHSLAFPDPSSSSDHAPFPTLSPSDIWQVQSGFLGYVVERLAGGYRRGITVDGSGSSRRRFMQASVFLTPGLDQHYVLAETVARTHLFRQFEGAVLAAEALGLRRVLGGCGLRVSRDGNGDAGACHVMVKYLRPLALFAVLCDRARLQYPELYADVPRLDAVGTVYTTLVERCFTHRTGPPPAAVSVPSIIRSIAGSSAASDVHRAAVVSSNSTGAYTSSNSSGGFRSFLSKAAKAMKLHSGGNSGSNSSGGGRGLPVVYIAASVACLNSFAVAPFSAQHVVPQSFQITTYDRSGLDGERQPRHHHHRGLHLRRHGGAKKGSHRRRRGKSLADLYAIPVKPQRQQWELQQRYQQRTAIHIDFTLDDCTTVVRNVNASGGVSGAAVGVSNSSVYVSGVGLDAEALTARARAGSGGSNDATIRIMAEASLSICHTLPLDIVHQFDAYEPLLAPVVVASSSASVTGEAAATVVVGEGDFTGPAAYMGVGLLCPSCVNVWREGEARATRVLLEQRSSNSSQLPPKPVKVIGAATPSEAQSSMAQPDSPPPPQTGSVAAANRTRVGAPPVTSWGTFTSGAPLGFPIDSTPCYLPAGHNGGSSGPNDTNKAVLSSVDTAHSAYAAPPVLSATSAVSPTAPASRANVHHDAWDSWGVQAPMVAVSTPSTVAATDVHTGSPTNSGSREVMTAAQPMSAPAPGDVMDELFGGLSGYSNVGSASSTVQQQQQPPRRQTLDDFF